MHPGPTILPELLMEEIQKDHLHKQALETFSQTGTFISTLSEFEKKHLPKCEKALDLLKSQGPSLERYVLSRRQILETQIWFNIHADAFFKSKDPTLSEKRKIEEIQKGLLDKLKAIALFLEETRKTTKKSFVQSYAPSLEMIHSQMEQIVRNSLHLSPKDPIEEAWSLFLKRASQEIGYFAEMALQQRDLWLEALLHECRALYFTRFKDLSFSFIYSSKGMQYVVMDVLGFMLGQGETRIASRCAELQSGMLHALIKPKTLTFSKEITEELKQKHKGYFIDTWREADIISHIAAPSGVIQIQERMAFEIDGIDHLFLIEKRYEDGTLENYFQKVIHERAIEKAFDAKTSYQCALQLLTGLVHIHQAGIIHRDIKPANILCDFSDSSNKIFVISDLSFACTTAEKRLHKEPAFSPLYSAPEYAKALLNYEKDKTALAEASSFKLDVWSLGILFFLLFFLEKPPWEDKLEGDLNKQIFETLEKISSLKPSWIPSRFHNNRYYPLISQMLDPDPIKRVTAQKALSILALEPL